MNDLGLLRHQLATCHPSLFARTVQPLWQELLENSVSKHTLVVHGASRF